MVSLNINIFLRSFIAAAGSLAFMFALSWRLTIVGNVREISEGTNSPRIVFFFTNAHIADKSFFENINNMLTTGMIPGLCAEEEKAPFCESMRNAARALDLPETKDTLWSLHVQHVRSNLHIVLAMSFVGDTLCDREGDDNRGRHQRVKADFDRECDGNGRGAGDGAAGGVGDGDVESSRGGGARGDG
jgi:hypothetical protein